MLLVPRSLLVAHDPLRYVSDHEATCEAQRRNTDENRDRQLFPNAH